MKKLICLSIILSTLFSQHIFASILIWSPNTKNANETSIIQEWNGNDFIVKNQYPSLSNKGYSKEEVIKYYKAKKELNDKQNWINYVQSHQQEFKEYLIKNGITPENPYMLTPIGVIDMRTIGNIQNK